MGVPLEWNVFMIFCVLTLFVGHADVGLIRHDHPAGRRAVRRCWPRIVVLGNLFPRKISFLPGMRYYAGNWDTTQWCMKPSAEEKIDAGPGGDREHAARLSWRSSTAARSRR